MQQLFIQLFINYVLQLLHVSPSAFLVPSERCSIEKQSIEYCGWAIPNILSTAFKLGISQKALGTLAADGNVMAKQVAATIHN
jgi:hypothetical protein